MQTLKYNILKFLGLRNKPKNGDQVKITWLPNSRNHPTTKSCYIGMEGTLESMSNDDWCLNLPHGACLLLGTKFDFTYIKF